MDFPPIPGGISNYLFHLWKHADLDRSVLMCGGEKLDQTVPFQIAHANLPAGSSWIRRHLRTFLMIPLMLFRFRDRDTVIHCGQVIAVGLASMLLNRIRGIPYVVYVYGAEVYSALQRPLRNRLMRAILTRASKVVAISHYTEDLLLEAGCPARKILLVMPGVEPAQRADAQSLEKWRQAIPPASGPILLSVARLVKRKGHLNVLNAIASLLPRYPNLLYIICGDGPYRSAIEDAVDDFGFGDRVFLCRHVPDDELPALHELSDVFVLTPFEDSDTEEVEGFGIVYLEANAAGRPVVASRSGGIPDAVEDHVSGLLVSPQDPRDLTSALEILLRDRKLRDAMGEQGQRRTRNEFAWTRSAKTLESGLREGKLL